ncbi:MAG: F0F1 ATP synthase subunit alpha, partial [Phormidesmis sp.]
LKQSQYSPRSLPEQVAVIYAGVNDKLNDIPVDKVSDYVSELIAYVNTSKKAFVDEVNSTKKLTDDAVKLLEEAIEESKQAFLAA